MLSLHQPLSCVTLLFCVRFYQTCVIHVKFNIYPPSDGWLYIEQSGSQFCSESSAHGRVNIRGRVCTYANGESAAGTANITWLLIGQLQRSSFEWNKRPCVHTDSKRRLLIGTVLCIPMGFVSQTPRKNTHISPSYSP